jgi:hypothetical protein
VGRKERRTRTDEGADLKVRVVSASGEDSSPSCSDLALPRRRRLPAMEAYQYQLASPGRVDILRGTLVLGSARFRFLNQCASVLFSKRVSVRESPTVALNFSAVKVLCNVWGYILLQRNSKFWAVRISSSSCVRFVPRALSGAVDIVREIALLPRAPSYNAGCSICWSINLRLPYAKLVIFLNTSSVTATIEMLLRCFFFTITCYRCLVTL